MEVAFPSIFPALCISQNYKTSFFIWVFLSSYTFQYFPSLQPFERAYIIYLLTCFLRISKVHNVNLTCIISGEKNVSFPLKVSKEKAYWMPLLLLKWHISNRKYSFLNNTIKNIDIKGSLISFITIAPGLFMFLNTSELVP